MPADQGLPTAFQGADDFFQLLTGGILDPGVIVAGAAAYAGVGVGSRGIKGRGHAAGPVGTLAAVDTKGRKLHGKTSLRLKAAAAELKGTVY